MLNFSPLFTYILSSCTLSFPLLLCTIMYIHVYLLGYNPYRDIFLPNYRYMHIGMVSLVCVPIIIPTATNMVRFKYEQEIELGGHIFTNSKLSYRRDLFPLPKHGFCIWSRPPSSFISKRVAFWLVLNCF